MAESAALSEIEGGEVSQKQTQENQIDLVISYLRALMASERHDYVLEIKVQNLGNEIIHSYHIDLEFPARVVEKSKSTAFLVESRSNREFCFFRSIRHGEDDAICPGDTKEVMSFPYHMDHDIYFNRGKLFEQPVKSKFYQGFFCWLILTLYAIRPYRTNNEMDRKLILC